MSIASVVTPFLDSRSSISGFCAGQRNEIRTWPSRRKSISSMFSCGCRAGGRTFMMMSARRPQLARVRADRGPGLTEGLVVEARSRAGAAFDTDGESQFVQLRDDIGRGRHAHFAFVNFSGNADSHCVCSRTFGGASGQFMLSTADPGPMEGSIGGTTAGQYTVPGSKGPRVRRVRTRDTSPARLRGSQFKLSRSG